MMPMTRTLSFLATLAVGLAFVGPAAAQQSIDPEGRYELIQAPPPTETPGKVEIVDVFWYG